MMTMCQTVPIELKIDRDDGKGTLKMNDIPLIMRAWMMTMCQTEWDHAGKSKGEGTTRDHPTNQFGISLPNFWQFTFSFWLSALARS